MTRTKAELLIAIVAVALGTLGFLFHWPAAEVLGLLFACVALGMVLFRALPADDSSSSTRS